MYFVIALYLLSGIFLLLANPAGINRGCRGSACALTAIGRSKCQDKHHPSLFGTFLMRIVHMSERNLALVTGASGGIGLELARLLAEKGLTWCSLHEVVTN
jgi:hypothetical protein